ncbi:class I SAM-dependent methyltransferase [Pseudodesulfovibrio tunisiensis]|uniref:class I SAM-dependent methyltransferase n=1 Tax=Pseudodesulfovibrio tunisiensis TaxID=463192 RepID=UPI001FB4B035|nr:class I SAM-dependent methyltransferase [Pseudodesulfovibrio tunisiensis]
MKLIEDSFLPWLRFANAGMLERGNVWCIDHAVKHMPESLPMIEIGSFCGLSTNAIRHFCRINGRDNALFCADKWIFEGAEDGGPVGSSTISHEQYRDFVMESFRRNVAFFSGDLPPHPVLAFSDEFFELWRSGIEVVDVLGATVRLGGPIGFAYVDGSHQPDQCRRDFANVHEFLAPGGFALFDDSSRQAPFGLYPFMLEIAARDDYELVAENPNFLFRKTR